MANLITLGRLLLLFVVVYIAYQPASVWQLIQVPLLIIVFASDGLDGYVARKRHEESVFGAMFDIAGDRITELTMWIVLADLGMVAIWVPLVFVVRGTVVDTIRANQVISEHRSPFSMLHSALSEWLVAGKFMRIFYAALKATAFCWILLIMPFATLTPNFWDAWGWVLQGIAAVLVYGSVVICIVRGLPVVLEFVYAEKDTLLGHPTTQSSDNA